MLVAVPRAVRDDPAFSSHPVAITCPDNQTGNQASEVTYLLRGRYLGFDATVHPYYPPGADTKAVSHVCDRAVDRWPERPIRGISWPGPPHRAAERAPLDREGR